MAGPSVERRQLNSHDFDLDQRMMTDMSQIVGCYGEEP